MWCRPMDEEKEKILPVFVADSFQGGLMNMRFPGGRGERLIILQPSFLVFLSIRMRKERKTGLIEL